MKSPCAFSIGFVMFVLNLVASVVSAKAQLIALQDQEAKAKKALSDYLGEVRLAAETKNPLQVKEPDLKGFARKLHDILDPILGQKVVLKCQVVGFSGTAANVRVALMDDAWLTSGGLEGTQRLLRYRLNPKECLSIAFRDEAKTPDSLFSEKWGDVFAVTAVAPLIERSSTASIVGQVGKNIPRAVAKEFSVGSTYSCELKVVGWRLRDDMEAEGNRNNIFLEVAKQNPEFANTFGRIRQPYIEVLTEWADVGADGHLFPTILFKSNETLGLDEVSWSPDGKQILVRSPEAIQILPWPPHEPVIVKDNGGIGSMNTGPKHRTIKSSSKIVAALWSPDSSKIALVEEQAKHLLIFATDDEAFQQRIPFDEYVQNAKWHPKGEHLIAITHGSKFERLYLVNLGLGVSSAPKFVDSHLGVYNAFWNRDGKRLMSILYNQVLVSSFDGHGFSKPEEYTIPDLNEFCHWNPWSPDGIQFLTLDDEGKILQFWPKGGSRDGMDVSRKRQLEVMWHPRDPVLLASWVEPNSNGQIVFRSEIWAPFDKHPPIQLGRGGEQGSERPNVAHVRWGSSGNTVTSVANSGIAIWSAAELSKPLVVVNDSEWSLSSSKFCLSPTDREVCAIASNEFNGETAVLVWDISDSTSKIPTFDLVRLFGIDQSKSVAPTIRTTTEPPNFYHGTWEVAVNADENKKVFEGLDREISDLMKSAQLELGKDGTFSIGADHFGWKKGKYKLTNVKSPIHVVISVTTGDGETLELIAELLPNGNVRFSGQDPTLVFQRVK